MPPEKNNRVLKPAAFMLPEYSGDFIQCLRGFYYTAKTGSMTAAAALMKRNQSALSHQIKSIESELGVKLFQGNKTSRTLTDEGKFLLAQVMELFTVLNETRTSLGSRPSDLEGEISLASMNSIYYGLIAARITEFGGLYPGVIFRHSGEAAEESLFARIESGEVEFGLIMAENIPQEFGSATLFESEFALITPKDGPYALEELPPLEEICHLPLLAPPPKTETWRLVTRQFARLGCKLKFSHIIGQQELLKQCVADGLGLGILDEFACSGELRSRLNVLPLTRHFPPCRYSVIWRSNLYMHPHLRAFLDFLSAKGAALGRPELQNACAD